MVGEQGLGRQPLTFGNENITVVAPGAHTLQNDGVEQVGVIDSDICGQAKRQVIWLKSRGCLTRDSWTAADW